MRNIKYCAALIGLALLLGCASQSRVTYNTLASVQAITAGAYAGYLDLVVTGRLPTNSVPQVSADYNLFQAVWSATALVCQWNTNAPATQPVMDAASKVLTGINQTKGTP